MCLRAQSHLTGREREHWPQPATQGLLQGCAAGAVAQQPCIQSLDEFRLAAVHVQQLPGCRRCVRIRTHDQQAAAADAHEQRPERSALCAIAGSWRQRQTTQLGAVTKMLCGSLKEHQRHPGGPLSHVRNRASHRAALCLGLPAQQLRGVRRSLLLGSSGVYLHARHVSSRHEQLHGHQRAPAADQPRPQPWATAIAALPTSRCRCLGGHICSVHEGVPTPSLSLARPQRRQQSGRIHLHGWRVQVLDAPHVRPRVMCNPTSHGDIPVFNPPAALYRPTQRRHPQPPTIACPADPLAADKQQAPMHGLQKPTLVHAAAPSDTAEIPSAQGSVREPPSAESAQCA